jgi:arginine decarboxylase
MFSQEQAPLFDGLRKHAANKPLQFHIPGHKTGKGMDSAFSAFIGENALSIDLINIEPLDDLHHPHGMIQEAQQLAAKAFGADYTFFSVQGTSTPIMAMVMSVCKPGDKIIVPRNVHKSVTSALIFSGAIPIFVHPQLDHHLGISHGITPAAVEKALEANPDAKGVLVINPTYFGVAADLTQIVDVSHRYNVPVLVDEAHGVHIHFHEQMPVSAMAAGADLAATSVHKLGGSLTQSSILNLREGLVRHEQVQTVLSMLTSTSTSYILLASLDAARRQLATKGAEMNTRTIQLANDARKQINAITGLYCAGAEILDSEAAFAIDPTKLLVSVKQLGISGSDAERWLRQEKNMEVELSDLYNLLFLITPGDTEKEIQQLLHALADLAALHQGGISAPNMEVSVPEMPVLSLSPRDAFYADTEAIPLAESEGRISAESIMVYPPGIPIFIPGEIISAENISYIKRNIEAGLPVQGLMDESSEYIRVIKEHRAFR